MIDKKKLLVKTKDGHSLIPYDDIIYFKSDNVYTEIYTEMGVCMIRSLKETEKLLPDELFIRVHRSYIVNVNKICRFTLNGSSSIKTTMDIFIPISETYKANFKKIIESNFGKNEIDDG